jgi:hypothetical protein
MVMKGDLDFKAEEDDGLGNKEDEEDEVADS